MSAEGISKEVANFLAEYIDSVVQLEVLLLLYNKRGSSLQPAQVAKELRIDPAWAEAVLTWLVSVGALEAAPSGFRYAPRTPQLNQTIGELVKAYEDRRVTIIGMIFSKPDPIRHFTDAFRFRKDEGT